ncbi:MAG: AsmA-like C-terminal domain-containing protein, partial [Pseudomonadota bacterium]
LTFGGVIHQSEGRMDMSGTFVPMSQINSFVNKIPLIGNLLTGGKNGGIIAATYAVKGPSNDPTVMVNPLSVLTPGFLRTLFFNGNSGFLGDESSELPAQKPKGYNN